MKLNQHLTSLLLLVTGGFFVLSSCELLQAITNKNPSDAVGLQPPDDVKDRYPIPPADGETRTAYVDFHNHITLKPYLQLVRTAEAVTSLSYAPLHEAAWKFNNPEETDTLGEGSFSNLTSYRQSRWDQLSSYKVVCTSFYAFERGLLYDENGLIRSQKRKLALQATGLTQERLDQVLLNRSISPFEEIKAEYAFLKAQDPQRSQTTQKVVLLRRRSDLAQLGKNQTGVVLSIEGGHALFGKVAPNRILTSQTTPSDLVTIKANIAELKAWEHPVMFVTLSHLIWNKLAGQSKGTDTDIPKGKAVLRAGFKYSLFRKGIATKPASGITGISSFSEDKLLNRVRYDNGFTSRVTPDPNQLGLETIKMLLDKKNGNRILIDLRHSSIKTRLEYYNFLEAYAQQGDRIPVVVSHAAASGKSLRLALATGVRPLEDRYEEIDDPEDFYKERFVMSNGAPVERVKVGGPVFGRSTETFPMARESRYNQYFSNSNATPYLQAEDLPGPDLVGWLQPSSNNLANEEYAIICRSGGIIGLTVEQRALGASMRKYKMDSIYGNKAVRQRILDLMSDKPDLFKCPGEFLTTKKDQFVNRFIAVAPLMRNIYCITQVTPRQDQVDIWKHLAIGTDFDGLIDPIDYFHTSDRLPDLEQFLTDNFELYCTIYGWDEDKILQGNDKRKALRQLFSENGLQFIQKNFPRE